MSNTARSRPRNSMRVTAEVLEAAGAAGLGGIRFTRLVQKVNLTTTRARRLAGSLVSAGLLAHAERDGARVLAITPRGMEFLDHCRGFIDLSEAYGVDL